MHNTLEDIKTAVTIFGCISRRRCTADACWLGHFFQQYPEYKPYIEEALQNGQALYSVDANRIIQTANEFSKLPATQFGTQIHDCILYGLQNMINNALENIWSGGESK